MRTRRNFSLDLYKILATVLIVFHHYQQVTEVFFVGQVNYCGGFFYFGLIVELFFVISGYLIAGGYVKKIEEGLSFSRFYIKRLFRFVPLMTIAAICYEVLLIIHRQIVGTDYLSLQPTFWGTISASLGIQEGWGFQNPCVNNPTWYISVLLFCYIMLYFIVWICKRWDFSKTYFFVAMIFLGVGINTYGINLPLLNSQMGRGFYAFFWGVLIKQLLENPELKKRQSVLMVISIALIILISWLIAQHSITMTTGISYTMTFVYYTALIFIAQVVVIGEGMLGKIIGRIGQISYDTFIWHSPMFILMYIMAKVFGWEIEYNSHHVMYIFTLACFITGTISYYCLEKPIQRIVDAYLSKSGK